MNMLYFENRIQSFGLLEALIELPNIFLCISGFIVTLALLKHLEKNALNVWIVLALKLLRSLPPYIFILAIYMFILPYLENGPMWKALIEPEVGYCQRGWWTNLLFLNNYLRPGEWCMAQSWYADVDIHCFIVGVFLVYLCTRWESHKVAILTAAFVLSCIIPFTVIYRNRYEGLLMASYDIYSKARKHETLMNFHTKTHNKFGCYVVGICSAFLTNSLLKKGYKFSKISSWAGVLLGVLTIAATVTARQILDSPLIPYNVYKHAFYAGFHTQLLNAGLMMIVIIQITTGFGALNSLFLTQNLFVPISRLSYWLFHVNFPVGIYFMASKKAPIHLTYEKMMFEYWGTVFVTFLIALYGYLIIEAPINHFITPLIFKLTSNFQSTPGKKDL